MRNILKMYRPASWWGARWRDALPAGNGRIGAAVYGSVSNEIIMLSHELLWHNSITDDLPDVSASLGEVRALLESHQPEKAAEVYTDAFASRGYEPVIGEPFPLGDLKISRRAVSAFSEYERSLNMETGEITVKWLEGRNKFTRRLFVSRVDNIVVLELSSSLPGRISADFSLGFHDTEGFPDSKLEAAAVPGNIETFSADGFLYFSAVNDDGRDYGAVTRCIYFGGNSFFESGRCRVQNADSVLLLTSLFTGGVRSKAWAENKGKLMQLPGEYQYLFKRHAEEHGKLFRGVSIELDSEEEGLTDASNEELLLQAYRGNLTRTLAEKMWMFGRYLLISGAYEKGLPLPLHGLWTGEWNPYWGFNMVNENLQMIYWQTLQGNLMPLVLPVFDYFENLMDDFRENARKLFGCRGIFIPAPTAPDSGLLKTLSPHIIYWTGGAGWIAELYFDYYQFTGDRTFLENRALPFLLESARFYEDFFTLGDDGFFISSPSVSPENNPGNYWNGDGMCEEMETTINASMDFSIAREVFTHLLETLKLLEAEQSEQDYWKQLLEKIPGYQVNEEGVLKEWLHPDFKDNYHHRHLSHAYPVFPGTDLIEEDNPILYRAFVKAAEKRLEIGLGEQSSWSLTHLANTFARMGKGEKALDVLGIFSRTAVVDTLFSMGNDWRGMGTSVSIPWAPFQIDANMGFTSAVQEMLLYSRPGMIKLLPALPAQWLKGSFQNMFCRGQIKVSLKWDFANCLITGTFLAASDIKITVKFPAVIERLEGLQTSESSFGFCYREVSLAGGKSVSFKAELSEACC